MAGSPWQRPPFGTHAHVPPEQEPLQQSPFDAQVPFVPTQHECASTLHAVRAPQDDVEHPVDGVQPHEPLTQAAPGEHASHETHVSPVAPHAAADAPSWQVPPGPEQQPPLHGERPLAPQLVVHTCADVSQAMCAGQSVCVLQPHVVPPRQARPFEPVAVQSTQVVPGLPQVVEVGPVAQVPDGVQQPPLHIVVVQVEVQVPLVVSQA